MPSIIRTGDLCTGHDHWDPRRIVGGSSTVRANGIAAARVGDLWEVHCCRYGHDDHDNPPTCHDGRSIEGSTTVRINGIAATRTGDLISCGSRAAGNNSTVRINGSS